MREAHTGLMSPSVCLEYQIHVDFSCRNQNQGVHVEFSVRPPSPLNTNSYGREQYLGSTIKFVEIYLLFTCITNLILAQHTQSVNGLGEPF